MIFVPDSYIPSTIYLPFYTSPRKNIIKLNDISQEIDSNGIKSIIHFDKHTPYIDFSKFNYETKNWYWYDINKFMYKMNYKYIDNKKKFVFVNIMNDDSIVMDNINLLWDDIKYESYILTENKTRLTSYSPIVILYNKIPLIDLTDYNFFKLRNPEVFNKSNKYEFYYDFSSRCYTNIDFDNIDINNIEICYYDIHNIFNVKCDMAANNGMNGYITPYIDNYMIKIHTQNSRI